MNEEKSLFDILDGYSIDGYISIRKAQSMRMEIGGVPFLTTEPM